ncbi:MAG TPA: hypothetical protein PLF13_03350 [candidate division Zixibacteria bacterium]|nr:hypothetical protein [candidate division Zixibacteria bacterium]
MLGIKMNHFETGTRTVVKVLAQVLLYTGIVVFLIVVTPHVSAESLETIRTVYLPLDTTGPPTGMASVLLEGGDTVVVCVASSRLGSGTGVWVQYDKSQPWIKVIGCRPPSNDWWADCDGKKRFEYLFLPMSTKLLPDSRELLVFDRHCGCLTTISLDKTNPGDARLWQGQSHKDYLNEVIFQDDYLLAGIYGPGQDMMVFAEKLGDRKSYRRMFPLTPSFQRYLDSTGLHNPECRAAICPRDNSFWVSINGYDFILIADHEGKLVDSVHIEAPDYILPAPPLSSIGSCPVRDLWFSSWTPTATFNYVAPGYMIMQYYVQNPDSSGNDIPRYGTLVWDSERRPVKIDVDADWQLAGSHRDGRAVFVNTQYDEEGRWGYRLNIARIKP